MLASAGTAPGRGLVVHGHAGFRGRPVHVLQVSARRSRGPLRSRSCRSWPSMTTSRRHCEEQIARGRMPLVEVDGFYLPDTKGVSLSHRAHQDDHRHQQHRQRRALARLLPQRRLLHAPGRGLRRSVSPSPRAAGTWSLRCSPIFFMCEIRGNSPRRPSRAQPLECKLKGSCAGTFGVFRTLTPSAPIIAPSGITPRALAVRPPAFFHRLCVRHAAPAWRQP